MTRSWQLIVLFAVCLALVVGAMTWVSWTALRLDVAQADARRQAVFEEDVRLALWRMDSALAPLIARENSRPYFAWYAFYPAERAYSSMFAGNRQDDLLVASPLLMQEPSDVLLYFQFEPSGELTSPQVPADRVMPLVQALPFDRQRVTVCTERLREVGGYLKRADLLTQLPAEAAPEWPSVELAGAASNSRVGVPREQGRLSSAEYEARFRNVQQATQQNSSYAPSQMVERGYVPKPATSQLSSIAPRVGGVLQASLQVPSSRQADPQYYPAGSGPGQVTIGMMKPLWAEGRLVLARHVVARGQSYVQGCWLDWAGIRQSLLDGVRDVLPGAQLEPVLAQPVGEAQRGRMLAALPVRLVPGEVAAEPVRTITSIRLSLVMAWVCVLLTAVAVASLVLGILTLSERRATFVSSVTHELRTPLTTLRMYTEMLAAGMVQDPQKRQQYLETLQREADRLGHLVENVLAYARLERGRARRRVEVVPLRELLERVTERLASRASQAGMHVDVACDAAAEGVVLQTDLSAMEQVLFNLVDNACKYAACGENQCIELLAGLEGRFALLRVRDYGPGISGKDARRLFRPFSKSAHDAAHSAPGVGLGLALSRRLAREMGGDLRLDAGVQPGACFVLRLPVAAGDAPRVVET